MIEDVKDKLIGEGLSVCIFIIHKLPFQKKRPISMMTEHQPRDKRKDEIC